MKDREIGLSKQGFYRALDILEKARESGDYEVQDDEMVMVVAAYIIMIRMKTTESMTRREQEAFDMYVKIARRVLGKRGMSLKDMERLNEEAFAHMGGKDGR